MARKQSPEEWRQRMQTSIDKHKAAAESGATLPDDDELDSPHPILCAMPLQKQHVLPEWLHPRKPESPSRQRKKPVARDYRMTARNNLRELDDIVREFLAQNPLPLPLFVAMLAKARDDVRPERLYAVHIVSQVEWSLAWPGNRAGKKPDGFWFTKRFNSSDRNMFARLLLHHKDAWI